MRRRWPWWHRFRVPRRTGIGIAVLAVLSVVVVIGGMWRASWIVKRLLSEWAVGQIAEQSGGVYRLEVGPVHFDWSLRRVAVDSFSLTTNRGVNTRRPQDLPGLRLNLYGCTISGIHYIRLIRSAGLVAGSLVCEDGSLLVEVPLGAATPQAARAFGERTTFLTMQQGVRLPPYAPRIELSEIVLPRMSLEFSLPPTSLGITRLDLERLEWNMVGVVIDPADSTATARPLFSRKIELIARNFITRPDASTEVGVGRLRASLTDSTMDVYGVGYAPTVSRVVFNQAQQYRRDFVKLNVAHIRASGIDFGAFVLGQGVRARLIEVDSVRMDVTSDKRLRELVPAATRRTPQQWIADLDETLSLDSLRVRNSELVYREYAPGREQPGVLAFTRLEAAAANVSHFVGRHTSADPMTLTVRAHVQDAGQLDVRVVMPLDARRFDMSYRGTLGAMPAETLNQFVVETGAVQIERGHVAGVAFEAVVRNGVASGTLTPRFNDLTVSVMREGSSGILGGGGFVGSAARSIASYVAKLVLRPDNPRNAKTAARTGKIQRTFAPTETLIGFVWLGVRDALLEVLKR